jgi:4-amino-4-deoxychorismate lyase
VNPRVLVDGVECDAVSAQDRGLSYGDGVFETMLVAAGRLPWWQAHLARLQRGCARLRIDMPDDGVLAAEARDLCRDQARAVLKLIVTRGAAGRGYSIASATRSTRILSLHPAPILDPAVYDTGVAVHECTTRLAIQPSLAGIKHLNRLEQVLARSEWDDPAVAEGLVQDMDGRIVSATAANVFIASRGRWFTPDLGRCGIEGVCRAWVMARFAVEVADIPRARLLEGDELFLSSSLRGILPVARFGGRHWDVGPMTRVVQQALWQELPAMDPQRASNA